MLNYPNSALKFNYTFFFIDILLLRVNSKMILRIAKSLNSNGTFFEEGDKKMQLGY